jgi:hypothetical protein
MQVAVSPSHYNLKDIVQAIEVDNAGYLNNAPKWPACWSREALNCGVGEASPCQEMLCFPDADGARRAFCLLRTRY